MEQLSGLDAAFIQQNSSRTPMHICAVLVYDTGEDGNETISRKDLANLCRDRLQNFPVMQRRLRQIPMGMDTPYWLDTTYTDWVSHISESVIESRGRTAWRRLQQTLAKLHGQSMDLRRPLWHIHLINDLHGLPDLPEHCQVLVLKIHHAAIDGISMAEMIRALHQEGAVGRASRRKQSNIPSPLELWGRLNINQIGRQLKLAETMGKLLPGFVRAREARKAFSDLPDLHGGGSRFNRPVRSGRHTGTILLSTERVMSVKRAVRRVTLNDIALACVAGGLRSYLQKSGQLPIKSLASGVPISLRSFGDNSSSGNRIATMKVGLATNIDDPIARLRAIHRYAVSGKKQINALGSGTIMDISDSIPPGVLAEGIKSMAWATELVDMPVPFHTMVSNVPGPIHPMFLKGARLVVPFGLGPIRDNMGLFHIVSSANDMMSLSFSACRTLLPDPDHYEDCLRKAFDDLHLESQKLTQKIQ
jgi:diacylglycerol O-acyltransferase